MRRFFLSLCFVTGAALTLSTAAQGSGNDLNLDTAAGLLPLNNRQFNRTEGPVLIQFWASWCHRCSSLFAELAAFSKDHPGLNYLAVSIDKDREDAQAYLKKHAGIISKTKNISFAHDGKGTLTERYQIKSVPEVLLLDVDGTILAKISGHFTKKDLFDMSAKLKQIKGATH